MIQLILFYKVTKEAVDTSRPDTALLCLTFEATLKTDKKLSDLELIFKGIREEESVIINITSHQLESMQSNAGMLYKRYLLLLNLFFYHIDKTIESIASSVSEHEEHLSRKEITNDSSDLLC